MVLHLAKVFFNLIDLWRVHKMQSLMTSRFLPLVATTIAVLQC